MQYKLANIAGEMQHVDRVAEGTECRELARAGKRFLSVLAVKGYERICFYASELETVRALHDALGQWLQTQDAAKTNRRGNRHRAA